MAVLDDTDRDLLSLSDVELVALVESTPRKLRPELAVRMRRVAEWRAVSDERGRDWLDPVGWCERVLGDFLWSKQREILLALQSHRLVAVPATHGIGKSRVASRAIAHFVACSEPGMVKVISTAPTFSQVEAILWDEVRRAHSGGRLPGRVNRTEWWVPMEGGNDYMAAFGRKPADSDEAGFQGIHAESGRILVVVDEADGVAAHMWAAFESLATSREARILAIGNPDDPGSYFAKILDAGRRESKDWHVIRISAFDAPCYTGEAVPAHVEAALLTREWVEDKRVRWGVDSPLWSSKVLAVHPRNVVDAVIPWSRLAAARSLREVTVEVTVEGAVGVEVVLGADIGGGGDATTVCERRGLRMVSMVSVSTPEPEDAAGLLVRRIVESGASRVQVDSGGIGWGVAGLVRAAGLAGLHNAVVVPVNAGSAATRASGVGEPSLANMRSQFWWWARENIGSWDLSVMSDGCAAELAAPRYVTRAGRIFVESKDDLRRRLGRSTDEADALLLCFMDLGPGLVGVVTPDEVLAAMGVGLDVPVGRLTTPGLGSGGGFVREWV